MIKKCLFPAAGYGTRFLPATKAMPKEMMPIVNKPLIEYGVREAADAGMTDICIVTGRGKRAIEDHFDLSFELETQIKGTSKEEYLQGNRTLIEECTFSYTRQREMNGLGHAILSGQKLVNGYPFGVILADDLCINDGPGVMAQLDKLYKQFRCSIVAVMEVPDSEVHKYGVVAGERIDDRLVRVTQMVEKPDAKDAPSNLAVIGRYILTPDIFEILENLEPGKNNEIQLTDALNQQAEEGCVIAVKFDGQRFDCGSMEGFIAATNEVYQRYYLQQEEPVAEIQAEAEDDAPLNAITPPRGSLFVEQANRPQ